MSVDHVVVVMDNKASFHVSYPKVKLAPTYTFTVEKRKPMAFRPKLTEQERRKFIETLRSQLGNKYDYMRVLYWLICSIG